MKACLALTLVLLFTAAVPARGATQLEWFRLQGTFSYADIDKICTNEVGPNRLYLKVELEDGKVTGATLKDGEVALPHAHHIDFEAAELAGISLDGSPAWIGKLGLNQRLLEWVFFHASGFDCRPGAPLKTLSPDHGSFVFAPETLPTGQIIRRSNKIAFDGRTQKDRAFQASLRFDQTRVAVFE